MNSSSFRAVLLSLMIAALPACSSILPARAPVPDLYQLSPVSLSDGGARPIAAQIIIEIPQAARGLDTDRIVTRSDPYEIKYLEGARWTDRAPRLVQSALVQGFESAGAFAGVGRPEDGLKSSYTLLSELRAFDVLSGGLMGGAKVSVVLAAKLVRSPGGEVLASRLLSQEVEAKGHAASDAVAAFDQAVKAVTANTAAWAADTARRSAKPVTAADRAAPAETATP